MQIHSFIKFQIILEVLFTHGLGEGQDVPIANILCTNSSGWRDAIRSCLSNGGRPLGHEEILTTHISDKNVFPVWTADYDVLSNTTDETSNGEYQPGRSMCGYATITILSFLSNLTQFNVTAVNYGNCAEMRPYVCEKELTVTSKIDGKLIDVINGRLLEINMDEMTWMDAKTYCNSTKRLLVRKSRLNEYVHYAYVNLEVAESIKLEVWIGSIGILDSRTVQSQKETVKMVKHGIFSHADGFGTTVVNQSNEFRALCGFESTKHVNETTLIDCLPGKESTNILLADSLQSVMADTPWLVFGITFSGSVLFVLICGGVVIYLYSKRKRRRAKFSVDKRVSDTTAHSNVSRHGESNPTGNDHGEGYATANRQSFTERELAIDPLYDNNSTSAADPDYTLQQMADITVHDTMYDTTDSEKAKPAGDKVGFHIYDRAIYDHGELLYDNTC